MPSVQEELAALRQQSLAKKHAAKLQSAGGLSTPEEEAAALQAQKQRLGSVYGKEAQERLAAGVKMVDKTYAFQQETGLLKKKDLAKQKEASSNLHRFNEAKLVANKSKAEPALGGKSTNPPSGDSIVQATATLPPRKEATEAQEPHSQKSQEEKKDEDDKEQTESGSLGTEREEVDDEIPTLEEVDDEVPALDSSMLLPTGSDNHYQHLPADKSTPRVLNRAEKKARKLMERMNLRPVSGISRVTFRRVDGQVFAIVQPDVYEATTTTTMAKQPYCPYVVFGEARAAQHPLDTSSARDAAAQVVSQIPDLSVDAQNVTDEAVLMDIADNDGRNMNDALDESSLETNDIELVMSQAGCTRSKAVTALRRNDGDLVNAILAVTR